MTPPTILITGANGEIGHGLIANLSEHGDARFVSPSSIAAYGLAGLKPKRRAGKVAEHAWCEPRTMYGINKLYCERLGRYYALFSRQLDAQAGAGRLDFRALRFPGLISPHTVPTGGTSAFAPEMVHAAAEDRPYACPVRPA